MLPTETTVSLADGSHINEKDGADDSNPSHITPTVNGSTKHSHVSTCPSSEIVILKLSDVCSIVFILYIQVQSGRFLL